MRLLNNAAHMVEPKTRPLGCSRTASATVSRLEDEFAVLEWYSCPMVNNLNARHPL
jgi:hypothetical protein